MIIRNPLSPCLREPAGNDRFRRIAGNMSAQPFFIAMEFLNIVTEHTRYRILSNQIRLSYSSVPDVCCRNPVDVNLPVIHPHGT